MENEPDGIFATALHAMQEITYRMITPGAEGNRELALMAYKLTQGLISLIDSVTEKQISIVQGVLENPSNDEVRTLAEKTLANVSTARESLAATAASLEWVMVSNGHLPAVAGHA
jgi:hypothetical protein